MAKPMAISAGTATAGRAIGRCGRGLKQGEGIEAHANAVFETGCVARAEAPAPDVRAPGSKSASMANRATPPSPAGAEPARWELQRCQSSPSANKPTRFAIRPPANNTEHRQSGVASHRPPAYRPAP